MSSSFISALSGETYSSSQHVDAISIPKNILDLIHEAYPNYDGKGPISLTELNSFRDKYISETLKKQVGELNNLEKTVIDTLSKGRQLTQKQLTSNETQLTFGQKLADSVASFGGSWTFIIIFGSFLFVWILLNVFFLTKGPFDPYPFILLNLILSCIAALQAPIIMMSQNRQEEKDRERAKQDYMINLKSELEIRTLHEKLDHLVIRQQSDLFDIQQVQIQMLRDILNSLPTNNNN
ncbi:MAG: hypothetical protein RLZZ65_144 [Bacteroidota bacterium]|jgi:uncharacterized membrane protein